MFFLNFSFPLVKHTLENVSSPNCMRMSLNCFSSLAIHFESWTYNNRLYNRFLLQMRKLQVRFYEYSHFLLVSYVVCYQMLLCHLSTRLRSFSLIEKKLRSCFYSHISCQKVNFTSVAVFDTHSFCSTGTRLSCYRWVYSLSEMTLLRIFYNVFRQVIGLQFLVSSDSLFLKIRCLLPSVSHSGILSDSSNNLLYGACE